MQDIDELVKSLNDLCKFLDDNYFVNSGGCCFIASKIAEHLDLNKIPYKLIVEDYCSKDYKAIRSEVRAMRNNQDSDKSCTGCHTCSHYYLQIPGIGSINQAGEPIDHTYTISHVKACNINWIYETGSWNDTYNPDLNYLIDNYISLCFLTHKKLYNEI